MTGTRLHELLLDAKKTVGALTVMEAAAVGYGLLDGAVAGYVTAGLGVVTAGLVYLLNNEKAPELDGHGSV